ncbi:MAG: ABC transporter permease [Planctomycetes bacterium]|nr:ABC transporter permease [Planctomycetota bacterium]
MSKIAAIAWREFTQTVMRKIFLLAVLGMPVLIIAIGVIAGVMMKTHQEPPLVGTVAIVDPTGELSAAAQIEFDQEKIRRDEERQQREAVETATEALGSGSIPPGSIGTSGAMPKAARGEVIITIERVEEETDAALKTLKQRVRDDELLAAAVIGPEVLDIPPDRGERPKFLLFVSEHLDSDHVSLIEQRLGASVVRVRAQRTGKDPDEVLAMLKRPGADTKRLLEGEQEVDASATSRKLAQIIIPMAFMMLIWIGTLTSSQHLLMTTIEEKSNRVMEVLLSAVSPLQLMTGKILGHGGVGLLIVLIYSSVGIAALIALERFTQFITTMDLVYLAIFYFMAYFMIASIMAAVGSAVSEIREANTLVTPVMMLLMVPWMLWMPITQSPNGMVATVCSFIPPMSPFAMILRHVAEEDIPTWQYPVSIIWGYICVLGMIWFAAKIFRVGVLMYGKPPSLLQLIKWARYS